MSDIKLTQKDKVPIKKVVYAQLVRYKVENKIHQDHEGQTQFIIRTMVFLIYLTTKKKEKRLGLKL